jgi:hypothetical protein
MVGLFILSVSYGRFDNEPSAVFSAPPISTRQTSRLPGIRNFDVITIKLLDTNYSNS